MSESALILADGLYDSPHAKSSHGLVRGPSRFELKGLVDAASAGRDAGELLDGRPRGIPIFASVDEAIAERGRPDRAVVGVATVGGVLPDGVRASLLAAARHGIGLVNGLHTLLEQDAEIAAAARASGATILDFRKPRPIGELAHWTGEITRLPTPRIAVLGTDCAVGKRTTCGLLLAELRARGRKTEMIYTGQTGWLQGYPHGFFFDATPNDFVCGELERVVLECARESAPELMLLEGQSAFLNPSGPCGSEFVLAAGARHVVLQHAPGREFFDDLEEIGCAIPPVEAAIGVAEALGAEVVAVTLNESGLSPEEALVTRGKLRERLSMPVIAPLAEGIGPVADAVLERL